MKSISTFGRSVRDLMDAIRDPSMRIFRVGMGRNAGQERISRQGTSPIKGVKVEDFEKQLGNRTVQGKHAKHKGENLAKVLADANRAARAVAKSAEGVRGTVLVVVDGVPMIWSQAALAMYQAGSETKYGTITDIRTGRHGQLIRQKLSMERAMGIAPEMLAV